MKSNLAEDYLLIFEKVLMRFLDFCWFCLLGLVTRRLDKRCLVCLCLELFVIFWLSISWFGQQSCSYWVCLDSLIHSSNSFGSWRCYPSSPLHRFFVSQSFWAPGAPAGAGGIAPSNLRSAQHQDWSSSPSCSASYLLLLYPRSTSRVSHLSPFRLCCCCHSIVESSPSSSLLLLSLAAMSRLHLQWHRWRRLNLCLGASGVCCCWCHLRGLSLVLWLTKVWNCCPIGLDLEVAP